MKLHYFDQEQPDEDDMLLVLAKNQGYVTQDCLLGGRVVMSEIKDMKNPCSGCSCARTRCNSTIGDKYV